MVIRAMLGSDRAGRKPLLSCITSTNSAYRPCALVKDDDVYYLLLVNDGVVTATSGAGKAQGLAIGISLKTLIDEGHVDRLCPSHDCICLHIHNERPDGTIPEEHDYQRSNPDQYLYIHRQIIPMLRELGTTDAQISTLFVDNPRRFLAGA